MSSRVLTTPVDELVAFVKDNRNCSIARIVQHLNLPLEAIERWLLVLEEYKVIFVVYRGFEGFVSYNEDKEKKSRSDIDVMHLKEIFLEKAREHNLSLDQTKRLWPSFILKYQAEIQQLFIKKAQGYGITQQNRIEAAWLKYKKDLEVLA
ncbi:hypothetical protein H6501_04395 [Candidatus Woesearchaeota archaeon]|nr:hypothetical protein [Nanoarchaeota archaeon]MCB9370811.1 hypothetical protein [Candidatus Woesearchaeota archaeon]USN43911.1 MAG: hypothetical protein H6500_05995 [Candidatus Woesearchaeota archaeon]